MKKDTSTELTKEIEETLECLKCAKKQNDMVAILPGTDIGNTIIKALEEVQQYRVIGTPEECWRNKDFLRFLANSMNQKKYETYLRIYNAVEKEGRDE